MRDKKKVQAYNAKYRKNNAEKIKKLQDDYYAKNRKKRITSARNWAINNKEQALSTRRKYIKTCRGKLTAVKGSAKTRGINFSLSDKQAFRLLEQPCFYCGDSEKKGIDRIDSKIGYTIKNCVSCCDICNYMKRISSQEDFISQCDKISQYHSDCKSTI